jgi:hypothetical protein
LSTYVFWAHALKIEVLFNGFAAVARHAAGDLSIAGHGSVVNPARLLVAACVASVMVIMTLMAGARVLVVVVVACFVGPIARICVTLFVGVLGVLTMHVAGLKTLVLARGETLLTACIMEAPLVLATLTIITSTTSVVASHAARPVGPVLLQKMGGLVIIALPKFVAHLALRIGSNFVELAARNEAFAQAGVVDRLEILCERLERLFAKLVARTNVLRSVSPVQGHREPFHGETRRGLLEVTLG